MHTWWQRSVEVSQKCHTLSLLQNQSRKQWSRKISLWIREMAPCCLIGPLEESQRTLKVSWDSCIHTPFCRIWSYGGIVFLVLRISSVPLVFFGPDQTHSSWGDTLLCWQPMWPLSSQAFCSSASQGSDSQKKTLHHRTCALLRSPLIPLLRPKQQLWRLERRGHRHPRINLVDQDKSSLDWFGFSSSSLWLNWVCTRISA